MPTPPDDPEPESPDSEETDGTPSPEPDRPEEHLFEELYEELRRKAHALFNERGEHTLQPTAVLHEAYLRLVARGGTWKNRAHFMGTAVLAMKRVLVDHARRRGAAKRGGNWARITLDDGVLGDRSATISVLALNDALAKLAEVDSERAHIAELVLFGGLKTNEVAEVVGVSLRTVQRQWRGARAFLAAEVGA